MKDEAASSPLLITNGTVLTCGAEPRVIGGGAVYCEGDRIVALGDSAELERDHPRAARIDAGGRIVMPGLICAHTHFYGAFARGMAIPGEPPANFMQVLERLWWKLDRALTLEDCRLSALVAMADAVRHGTTTLIDHHASPSQIDGSLDALAEAARAAGLRVGLCYEVTDRNGPAGARAGIAENVRFLRRLRAGPDPKLGAALGLHASFTVGNETMAACVEAAWGEGAGFHIHLAEDPADQADSLSRYGARVAERLADWGVLGERTLVAHAIHIDAAERELLRSTGTLVSHQPRSNMNNAVGVAAVEQLLDAGVTVGLGNDGFTNNMFSEIHTAYLLHKLSRGDPRALPGDRLMTMAFANNAAIAGRFFARPLGVLAPGASADLVVLDYAPYTPLTAGNYPWHIVFGMDGSHVTHTICGGQVLMRERELLTLDEVAIAAQARAAAPAIWQRVEAL